jgi:hypothetical protein
MGRKLRSEHDIFSGDRKPEKSRWVIVDMMSWLLEVFARLFIR